MASKLAISGGTPVNSNVNVIRKKIRGSSHP